MMKMMRLTQALVLLCCVSVAFGATRVILDGFTEKQNLIVDLAPPYPTISRSSVAGTMLGGERDSALFGVSGLEGIQVSSQVIAGSWFLACQRTADCKGSLTYDGKDASPNINFSGLGSIDFTNNGANALTLTVQTDIDTFYNLTFYQSGTSGAKFATARFATLTGPPQQYLVPFTSFTSSTGMDFSKVGSYVLFAEGGADVDSTASLFATFANDISGNVFRDCNINGVKDSGETSITGVNVTLYDSSTRLPIKSAFTDASGNYILPTVPGSYFVCAAPSIGIPTTPATNCTGTINVVIGVDYTNNNFGFTIPVTVTPPADRTVNCSASTAPANTGTATGTGCSTPTITFSDSETSTCNGRKTITRTWTATLGADSASRVQIITTFDNTVPIFTNFPTNKTVVCTGSTDTSPASQGTPAATDNCSSALITSIDIASAGGCTAPLIRTWTATDDCGNAVSRNQSITVTDTTAPVVDFFPPSYSTSCTGDVSPASAGIPTISDVCSGVQIPTSTDSGVTGTCTKTFTRTWTMRDTCGNTVTRPQTISRVDGDSPSFVNFPQDVTRQCGASTTPANTGGAPTGTDPCNNGATVTFTDTSAPGTCGSIITRTWRVADSCGNFITQVQTITVTDSAAPTLTTVSGRTIGCSAATTVAALGNTTVTDCTPNPVLTITDATFGNSCVGGFVRTFSASDNCGNTNSTTQTVNVVDVVAPVVTFFPANFSISCNGDSTPENNGGVPAYTDACNGVVDPTFTDGSPTGSPCNVTTLRTWKMADACGNTVQRVQAFFKADLTAPSLTATPADITIECGSDNSTASTEFPTAAAIDDCSTVSKSFSDVTTGPVCNRLITRTFRFLDQCSRSITYAQKINVTDTTKPTFIFRPRDLTIGCTVNSQVLSNTNGSAVAVDSCTAVTITRVDVNSTLACGTLITRTWRAQDACGNFDTFDQSITVTDNINPVFVTFPADRNLNCSASIDSAVQGVPTASDSCSGVQAITFIDNDNQNTCNRVINRTFTVSDNCGNTISRSQILRLTDTTAPFFDQFPAAASVPCDGSTDPSNFATPTVFADDCNVAQTITSADVGPTGNTCTKTLTRTFTASDDCGNKRTRSQVITVTDNTQPILSDTPQNIDLECGSSTNVNDLGRPTSFDSCGTFPVTFTDRSTGDSCDRTITRTFSVTDGCTTAVTSVQVITVSDNFAPVLTNSPADIQLECGSSTAVGTLGRPTATDACNAATTTLTSADVTTTIDACTRQIVRTFTTNDGCGNIATSTQTITLVDSTKPVFDANFPADTVLECGSTLPVTAPTAKDNCNTVTVTKTDFTDGAGCEEPVTRTWRAQDACGNFVERDQLITLRDRTPPVFVGFPSTITIDCEADIDDLTITGAAPTGTDSCSGVNDPTYTDVDTATGCNAQVTRTWVLTDTCGNSVRQDQIIRIRDTTKPSFDTFPDDVSRDCADGSSTSPDSTGTPTGVDDCQTPSITSSDRSTGINCPTTSEIIRTWTIRDGCGNSDTRDQRITLTLSQPPVLTVPPQITVECGTSVLPAVTGTATATSSCGVRFNITYVDNADEGICPKTLIRTWTVTDICGNTDSDTQTILQTDTTKPVFISFPSDKTVGCEDNTDPSVTGAPTAADNCDDSLCQRLTYNDVQSTGPTTGTCTPDLIIDRTWTIVDQCDNSFSRTQRITVKYVRFSGNCTQTNCPADPCTDAECAALGSSSCNCCAADRSCNAVPCTAVPCTSVTCKPVACTCPTSTAAVDFCDDSLDVPCVPQVVYVLRSGGSPSSGNSPSSNNSPSSGNNNKSSSSASTLFSYFSLFLFALIFLFKF